MTIAGAASAACVLLVSFSPFCFCLSRQKAAKLWAESQRLQKMLQAAAQNRRIGSLQEFFPRFTGRREIRRARTSMRLADGRSRPCGQNRLLSSFLPKAGEVKE